MHVVYIAVIHVFSESNSIRFSPSKSYATKKIYLQRVVLRCVLLTDKTRRKFKYFKLLPHFHFKKLELMNTSEVKAAWKVCECLRAGQQPDPKIP